MIEDINVAHNAQCSDEGIVEFIEKSKNLKNVYARGRNLPAEKFPTVSITL